MVNSGDKKKVLVTVVLVMSMLLAAFVIGDFAAEEAEASMSEKDERGYYYMDSIGEEPRTSYNWIDVASTGPSLGLTGSGSQDYDVIPLPWDFPFYENNYEEVYVHSRGYLCLDSFTYTTSYSSGMPQTGNPNPMIAVCWGYGYSNAYYQFGQSNNMNYLAIEWGTFSSYGQHCQVILYESGVIKMQYQSSGTGSYVNGYYHNIGIEDETGSVGTIYKTFYDQTLQDNMAIEFSYSEPLLGDVVVENAHRDIINEMNETIPVCYADYQDYKFTFNVTTTHPEDGSADLNDIRLYFGPPSLGIFAQYRVSGGQADWYLGGGESGPGNGTIEIDIQRSRTETDITGLFTPWNMVVYVRFQFAFPWTGMIPVTLWARGAVSLPNQTHVEDLFYLDNELKAEGQFQFLGEDGRELKNEGYTMDNETVTFTGVRFVFNMTSPNATYYPQNDSFHMVVIDDELTEYKDMNVSGREFEININMPLRALRKEFRVMVEGIPPERVLIELPSIALKVDDSTPTAPAALVIRADSFKDKQRTVDNDDTLYLSWGSVSDTGSGVREYRLSSTPDQNNESAVVIPPRVTSWVWQNTTVGDFKVYIWAVDNVGHIGEYAEQSILIDKSDPIFTDLNYNPNNWLKTVNPKLTITAMDGGTIIEHMSGVRRSTAEYAISTDGIEAFEDWISVGLFDEDITRAGDDDVEISVQPRFVEGTNNYIKFRVKDWAGNGYAVSDSYNLKIDNTPVSFEQFFPTQGAWHNLDIITDKEVSLYIRDDTSGIDTTDGIYYRISHELDEKGNYIWDTGIQPQGGWEELPRQWYDKMDENNLIWIHFPYEGFLEGEMNFIQFLAKDVAETGTFNGREGGPWTLSEMYQVLVNTLPVAKITSPPNLAEYNITEIITFDASGSYDVDVDAGNLKYEWKEGNTTISTDMVFSNFRFETTGWHTVTLYVGDSGHKGDDRALATVSVKIVKFIPSRDNDTDTDGMDDLWEWEMQLDFRDGSDADEDPDADGYTNIQEYLGNDGVGPYRGDSDATDPWDATLKPEAEYNDQPAPTEDAPFAFWVFIIVVIAAIIIAALIVVIGYLRIHREEESEKREEAEEEAMLATPQLDIPTMPEGVPMVDPSVPTLPQGTEEGYDQSSALPPAQTAEPQPMEAQPQPMEAQPQQQENPMYQEAPQEQQNPLYEGQQ